MTLVSRTTTLTPTAAQSGYIHHDGYGGYTNYIPSENARAAKDGDEEERGFLSFDLSDVPIVNIVGALLRIPMIASEGSADAWYLPISVGATYDPEDLAGSFASGDGGATFFNPEGEQYPPTSVTWQLADDLLGNMIGEPGWARFRLWDNSEGDEMHRMLAAVTGCTLELTYLRAVEEMEAELAERVDLASDAATTASATSDVQTSAELDSEAGQTVSLSSELAQTVSLSSRLEVE